MPLGSSPTSVMRSSDMLLVTMALSLDNAWRFFNPLNNECNKCPNSGGTLLALCHVCMIPWAASEHCP